MYFLYISAHFEFQTSFRRRDSISLLNDVIREFRLEQNGWHFDIARVKCDFALADKFNLLRNIGSTARSIRRCWFDLICRGMNFVRKQYESFFGRVAAYLDSLACNIDESVLCCNFRSYSTERYLALRPDYLFMP